MMPSAHVLLVAYTVDDEIPGIGIGDIENTPEEDDSQEPVACMIHPFPHLTEVELRHHDDQHDQTKGEESILISLFHSLGASAADAGAFLGSSLLFTAKRALSPSSRFS